MSRTSAIPKLPRAVLLGALTVAIAAGAGPPNFILVLTDDHGWSQLSFAMDPEVPNAASSYLRTPNMARLAARGMRFANGYSPAPLCTPSRRSIFCGMTPARQRGTEFPSEFDWRGRLTIPKALKLANRSYRAAHFGKFGHQMGASPKEVGFDETDGWTTNATGNGGFQMPMEQRAQSAITEDPKLAFTITSRAIEFMEREASKRPFYVQVSHYATHIQVQTRRASLDWFRAKAAPDRAVTPAFAGMLFDLDEAIGQLLDAIERLGLADTTYVILTADNGGRATIPGAESSMTATNRPLRGAKHSLFEGGIRVPFVVAGPGIAPNSISRVPVTGYDLLPTIYDLAGGRKSLPPDIDGGSFRNLLENAGAGRVDRAFAGLVFHRPKPRNNPASAIRFGDYKLLLRYPSGRRGRSRMLINLATDVGEQTDLSSEMPEKADELERLLLGYLRVVNAERFGL